MTHIAIRIEEDQKPDPSIIEFAMNSDIDPRTPPTD